MTIQPVKFFIASSNDLKPEREKIKGIISSLQNEYEHLKLQTIRWEDDAERGSIPEGSDNIQHELNKLLKNCQCTIALFYSRVGPFTKEEVQVTLELDKKLLLTFKKGFQPNGVKATKDFLELQQYKEEVDRANNVLYSECKEGSDFELVMRESIRSYINNHYRVSLNGAAKKKNAFQINFIPNFDIKELYDSHDTINSIHEGFTKKKVQKLILSGVGGIGKSTHAKAYISKYGNYYDNIIWSDALKGFYQSLYKDTIMQSYLKVDRDFHKENTVYSLLNKLNQKEGLNLWVIDNCHDDITPSVLESLPGGDNWRVLFTGRVNNINLPDKEMEPLSFNFAEKLFCKYYKVNPKQVLSNVETSLIEKIVHKAGRHPLIIELLSKLSVSPKYNKNLQLLFDDLYEDGFNLADTIKLDARVKGDQITDTIIEIISALYSMHELENNEKILLRYWGLLSSQYIEIELIEKIFPIPPDELYSLIHDLIRKGWILKDQNKYLCKGIIQEAVLNQSKVLNWQPELSDFLKNYLVLVQDKDVLSNKKSYDVLFALSNTLYGLRNYYSSVELLDLVAIRSKVFKEHPKFELPNKIDKDENSLINGLSKRDKDTLL